MTSHSATATAFALPMSPSLHPFRPSRSLPRTSRPFQPCRTAPSAKMVRVSVPISVEAPPDYCHTLFSDLSRMPQWSSTLESVTRDQDDPTFSEWVFSWNGIRLSWRARDEDEDTLPPGEDSLVPGAARSIRWRSVSGLQHIGLVEFLPVKKDSTKLVMTVDYDIASLLAAVMQSGLVSTFVENAIESDLQKFRAYTLRSRRKERIAEKKSQ